MIPAIVAALLQQGLGLLGNAVLAKGKDIIEEKLGVSLEDKISTPEGLLELKKLEFSHQAFLVTAAQEDKRINIARDAQADANTASAREMNEKVQESINASWLAKNASYVIDFFIVASTTLLVTLLFWKIIPDDNQNLAYLALGSMLTMCGQILNFHRGSTSRSANKDVTIQALSKGAR